MVNDTSGSEKSGQAGTGRRLSLLDREVWLLDEPTAALDGGSRDSVIAFLAEQQRQGKTIVAVSHDSHFCSQCSMVIQLC